MSKIKSALELALEKTENVKTDPEALKRARRKEKGQTLAADLMDKREKNIKQELKDYSAKERKEIHGVILDTLLTHLTLPAYPEDTKKLENLKEALKAFLSRDKAVEELFGQMQQLFQQFLDDKEKMREALEQRYEPTLRQKEQKLAQQTGRKMQLTAEQDPEFMDYLNQNMKQLEDQYKGILDQAAGELRRLL